MRVLAVIIALFAVPAFAQSPTEAALAAAAGLEDARVALDAASGRSDRVAAL